MSDARRSAPSAERNLAPIVDALVPRLADQTGLALEIGAGTGQHAAALAPRLPDLEWLPTDADAENLASIAAWAAQSGSGRILAPRCLDATSDDWALERPCAVIYAFNVIHITPWRVTVGLAAGAGRHLSADGLLVFYGPFREAGAHTAPSNAEFDAWLKAKDPGFGVRDLEDVAAEAARAGLELQDVVEMPANNRLVFFRKQP